MKPLIEAEISFNIDGMPRMFKVYHNLSPQFGLSIENAVESWLVRTKQFTVKSFCKYVQSKDPTIICISKQHTFKVSKHE